MEYKRSSKGVQSRNTLTYEDFKKTVYFDKQIQIKNVSIRAVRNEMSTVEQLKTGLKNVFVKAYVENDKITVTPFKKFIQP